MKKFRFSLEKVLRYKKMLKEQKEAALAKAYKDYFNCKEEQERLEMLLEEGKKNLLSGKIRPAAMVHRIAYIDRLTQRLSVQISLTQAAMQKVLECRRLLVEADKEYRVLEKLKERQYREYMQYVEKEAQKELDDVATSAFVRQG